METTVEITKESMLTRMQEMNKANKENTEQKKTAVAYFKNAQKVGNKIFLDIPLEMMKVDHEMYQRPIQRHWKKLAQEWNNAKCDPLMVNYRADGFFYILDGQHRFEAAKVRGIESLVCVVFVGMTIKEEAEHFVEQNEGTKKLTPYDTYKANICRGNETDCLIKRICDEYGVQVIRGTAPQTLRSVTAARTIIRNSGAEGLRWIFDVIKEAHWDAYKETYMSSMLTGFAHIYQNHATDLNATKRKLVTYCKKTPPKEVISLANLKYPTYGERSKIMLLLADVVAEENMANCIPMNRPAVI